MRTISSALTLFFKWIVPLWIAVFGAATLMAWGGLFDGSEAQAVGYVRVIFLAVWLLGLFSILWICVPLKRVRIDAGKLYISNYFTEITVPFTAVREITENRWVNINPVTIHLASHTVFGDRIRFMPTSRAFVMFSSHPIVTELRQQAATGK